MYQVNIPLIYYELERREKKTMSSVLLRGSIAAIILYIMIGIFGYLTFIGQEQNLGTNILMAPYKGNIAITIVIDKFLILLKGNFALFFAIVTAAPLVVLPAKDSVEEIFFKKKGMDFKINCLVTFSLIIICYVPAIFIKDIGDAITIAGCTINPVVMIIEDDFIRLDSYCR